MNLYSEILSEIPDKEKYPLYYKAKHIETILREGEILFIPQGWFHYVFSEEINDISKLNVAINFWYDAIPDVLKSPEITENTSLKKEPGINNDLFMHYTTHSIPFKSSHKIEPTFDDIKNVFNRPIFFEESQIKCFISPRIPSLYNKYMSKILGNFQDFYENKSAYILQEKDPHLDNIANAFNVKLPLKSSHWWINHGNGNHSMIHCDTANNLLCQLMGSKRVILFPPSEFHNLYLIDNNLMKF